MKPRGSIEIFVLLLGILGVAMAGVGPSALRLPMVSLNTSPAPAPRSLHLALGQVMSQGLTDLDELFFLTPEAFLMALTTYFRVLRDQQAYSDEIFLLLKRFLYEFASVSSQLRMLPHLPKGLLKRSLVSQLEKFSNQFKDSAAPLSVAPAEQLRQLIEPAQVVRIKDAYTENYLVENQGLFKRLADSFFGQSGLRGGPKLLQRLGDFLDRLQYLRCINASQKKLYSGILEGLLATEENKDINIPDFRAKVDKFLDSLLESSYLNSRAKALNQLDLPSTRDGLAKAYEDLWADAPVTFFPEMQEWYASILRNGLNRAVDDSTDSLSNAHETVRIAFIPPFNERNFAFKAFHLFANTLGIEAPRSMGQILRAYIDEVTPMRLVSAEALADLRQAINRLAEIQLQLKVIDQHSLESVMEAHHLFTPLPGRHLRTQQQIKSLFSTHNQSPSLSFLGSLPGKPVDRFLEGERWTYLDQRRNEKYADSDNEVSLNINFLSHLRKVPKTLFSKEVDFQKKARAALKFHLQALQQMVHPFKTFQGLCRLRQILGAYTEHLALNDMIQPRRRVFLMYSLIRLLVAGYRTRSRYSIALAFRKFKDRTQVLQQLSLKATSQFKLVKAGKGDEEAVLRGHIRRGFKTGAILGHTSGISETKAKTTIKSMLWNKFMGVNLRKSRIDLMLKKANDKFVRSAKSSLNVRLKKWIEKHRFEDEHGNLGVTGGLRRGPRGKAALGYLKMLKLTQAVNKNSKLYSYLQQNFPFKKNLAAKINFLLKKSNDKFVRSAKSALNVRVNKSIVKQQHEDDHGNLGITGGLRRGPKSLVALGYVKLFKLTPTVNKNAKIYNYIQQNFPFKQNLASKFELMLKKLKDKFFRNHQTAQSISNKLWFDRHKGDDFGGLRTGKSTGVIGSTRDFQLPNPNYGLNLLNCFEQHFADIPFMSWTELHTAMKQYLDQVASMDFNPTELNKVKLTLAYLRPFYRLHNFQYYRLYVPFQSKGKVELQKELSDATLLQGLQATSQAQTKNFGSQLVDMVAGFLPAEPGKDQSPNAHSLLVDQFNKILVNTKIEENFENLEKDIVEDMKKSLQKPDSLNVEQMVAGISPKVFAVHLLQTRMASIIDLKRQLHFFEVLSPKSFNSMLQFFRHHSQLLAEVLGVALHQDLLNHLQILAAPGQETIKFSEVFALDWTVFSTNFAALVAQMGPKTNLNIKILEILRRLFTEYPKTLLLLKNVAIFELSSEVQQSMGFCSREAPKIQVTLDKIRSNKFWRVSTIKALRATIFPKVQELTSSHHSLIHTERFKDTSHLLKPFTNLVIAKAISEATRGVIFKKTGEYKHFIGRIINNLRGKETLNHASAKAMTALYGSKAFLHKGQFRLGHFIGRINMRLFNARLVTDVQKLAAEAGVIMPVHFGRNKNYQAFARVKAKVLQPLIEGIRLRKDLVGLFGTHHTAAEYRTRKFLARLKRMRVKFISKNLAELRQSKRDVPQLNAVFKPLEMRRFWATKHFKREVFNLSKLSHYRVVANFLKNLQSTGHSQQYFAKTKLKMVLKLLLNKSNYSRIRLPLQRIFSPLLRPESKVRFKQILRPSNEKLKALRTSLSSSLYKSLTHNMNTQRIFFKILDASPQKVELNRRVGAYLRKKAILFDPSRLSNFRARFKALELLNIQKKFLEFVRKVRGPSAVKRIKQIQNQDNGRIKFKQLMGAVVVTPLKKTAKITRDVIGWKLNRFRGFLRDFKRMYTMAVEPGKRVKPSKSLQNFVKALWALRLNKKLRNWDLGRIVNPSLNAPGKRVEFTRPEKIICKCECCLDFTSCPDSLGCNCDKLQFKISNDPQFVLHAEKMVNLNPSVNFHLHVRDPQGGYREVRTLRFAPPPADPAVAQLEAAGDYRSPDNRRV